jgi:UDP-N-acetylmuramoyl-L-alanyl-D-glutamate--2,6-diaminopimelate ligase
VKWPELQKDILDILYPLPQLKLFGITGTNGKTTTTDLILQLGDEIGKKGISIGTLGVRTRGKTIEDFGLTSPSFIDLRKYLNRYGKDKDFCVMEVSSHALVQQRLYGLRFDGGGWLSFSQDHLDYHQNLENYFKSKCLIFDYLKPQVSLYLPSDQRELFQKIGAHYKNIIKAPTLKQDLPLFFKPQFNKNNLEVARVNSVKIEQQQL